MLNNLASYYFPRNNGIECLTCHCHALVSHVESLKKDQEFVFVLEETGNLISHLSNAISPNQDPKHQQTSYRVWCVFIYIIEFIRMLILLVEKIKLVI